MNEELTFPSKEFFLQFTGNETVDVLKENIDRLERNDMRYAVWGAASTWQNTKCIIEDYTKKPSEEKYIIDNNSSICDGIHILTPAQFKMHMEEVDTIFICVYVADLVAEQVKKMGFGGNVVPMVCVPWAGEAFIVSELKRYDDYNKLFHMVADDWSRRTLVNWLLGCASGNIALYSEINGNSKYKLLDNDILKLCENEHFVDVGAFTGDTIEVFLELTGGKYNSITAIEAETTNYNALVEMTEKLPNVNLINMAAGKENGEVRFIANQSECGYISDSGDVMVPMTTLDGLEEIKNATFIKISANGFEMPIIEGARNIIKKNKPKLSYYCAGTQRWDIPLLLKEIVPEYKIYLRHYGYGIQGMIGYAVCE